MASNPFLDRYTQIRAALAAKFADNPRKQELALRGFDSAPQVQLLRQKAGLAPLSTAKQEVQKTARQRIQDAGTDLGKDATGVQSASAGIARGMFGIPEILAAAGERFLPSSLTGNNTDASFSNILQMIRAKDTAAIDANPNAGLVGELGGGAAAGSAAGKALMAGAGRLASAGAPAVSRVAQAIENVGTLRKGQKLANAGKLAVIGAAGGGAQAAGEGGDPITGAAEGAVVAPAFAGAASSLGKFVLRPAADVLGLSTAGSYLRRFTKATTTQMQQRLDDFRARTGAEPTLLELLPLEDRNRLIRNTVAGRDPAVQQASEAIRARTANVQPEMQDVVQGATSPQRLKTQRAMVQALTDANGGTAVPGDAQLALRASQSPTDMLRLRRVESQRIMAPHDSAKVADNFSDLIPQHPVQGSDGTITMTESDPEASRAIRSVAGSLPARKPDQGITVQEITNMISDLRDDAAHGGIDGRAADRAAHHLMDLLQTNVPEAGAAAQQMRDAYAAHSRMAEGMGEGWQQRLRDEIQVGTSNTRAQGVQNAYDTEEGTVGRQLGTTNRLTSNLSGTPQQAASTTIHLARNGNPAIPENLGQTAGDQIQTAAEAQGRSLEALASAGRSATSGDGSTLNPDDITTALLALGPHPFAKARLFKKLMSFSAVPAGKARTLVDMMLSQDPRLTARAVQALGNEPNGAAFLKSLATGAVVAATDANAGTSVDGPETGPSEDQLPVVGSTEDIAHGADTSTPDPYADIASEAPADVAPAAPAVKDPYADIGAPAPGSAPASPYAPVLASIYTQENPVLVDLVQRVKQQESHGDQKARSKKGAVGVMQLMPGTAPEAAKLAGIPWDPKAYQTDATYNEILGHAYLASQLRKYGGDVSKALAAYNAGPGAADQAIQGNGDNWLGAMPAETQDYVSKVGG